MTVLVQEKLRAVLVDHGRRVMDDPQRVEALLRDYCGHHRREIAALISALKEGVPASLSSAPTGMPQEALIATLGRRLEAHQGLNQQLARWAAQTWTTCVYRRLRWSRGGASG
jgi:hypothetical protein